MNENIKVFDSWALLAFLGDEPSADIVEKLIIEANQNSERLLISAINMGEVWYSLARKSSDSASDDTITELINLGIELVQADWVITRQAAYFKAKYRLAFADCFAASLAKIHMCQVVTGDKEFRQLTDEISVLWL